MKKNNKKGFTLAELLIVVAIIAILTAIAIPVFTAQLDKSKLATATANVRSIYAEYVADCLSGEEKAGSTDGKPVEPTQAGFSGDDYLGSLDANTDLQGCTVSVAQDAITITSPKSNTNTVPADFAS